MRNNNIISIGEEIFRNAPIELCNTRPRLASADIWNLELNMQHQQLMANINRLLCILSRS